MFLPAITLILLTALPPAPTATLEVAVANLHGDKGQIHVCATRSPAHFPDCRRDPAAIRRSAAAGSGPIRLTGLAPGRYAVSLFHDANANGRLDKMMGMPREGFGFSRNPVIRFGAPKFASVSMDVPSGFTRILVRMQYLL